LANTLKTNAETVCAGAGARGRGHTHTDNVIFRMFVNLINLAGVKTTTTTWGLTRAVHPGHGPAAATPDRSVDLNALPLPPRDSCANKL